MRLKGLLAAFIIWGSTNSVSAENITVKATFDSIMMNIRGLESIPTLLNYSVTSTYYTDNLALVRGPLLEEEFIGKVSNIGFISDNSYQNFEDYWGTESDTQTTSTLFGTAYLGNAVISGKYSGYYYKDEYTSDSTGETQTSSRSGKVIELNAGVFVSDNTLLKIGFARPQDDYSTELAVYSAMIKNYFDINGFKMANTLFGISADEFRYKLYSYQGEVYITDFTSVGFNFTTEAAPWETGNVYGINANHFFNPAFMLGLYANYKPQVREKQNILVEQYRQVGISSMIRF